MLQKEGAHDQRPIAFWLRLLRVSSTSVQTYSPLGCQALVSCARPTGLLDHDPYHSASLLSFPNLIWSWVILTPLPSGSPDLLGTHFPVSYFTLVTPPPGSDGTWLVGFAKYFLLVAVLHQKCQYASLPQVLSLHPSPRKKLQLRLSLANTWWLTILATLGKRGKGLKIWRSILQCLVSVSSSHSAFGTQKQ